MIQVGTQKMRLLFNSHFLALHLKTISGFCSFINSPGYLFKQLWKPDPYSPCVSPYKFKAFQSHSLYLIQEVGSSISFLPLLVASVLHRPTACETFCSVFICWAYTTGILLGKDLPRTISKPTNLLLFFHFPGTEAREKSGIFLYVVPSLHLTF